MLAVETTDLTKEYRLGFWGHRRFRALDRLTLQVEAGEVFGLLGPNGAGKSTTLKLLFRLIFPTSGSIRILGKPGGDRALRQHLGFLPENPSFYEHLTAEELLNYTGSLFNMNHADTRSRAQRLLERLGLLGFHKLALRKFSKGMVQRLGIAQALINDPEIVFLDEPMSGLDPMGRRDVRNLILELRGMGKTIVFSTHILSDAETLCDRVAILAKGRLLGCGELNKILGAQVVATEMVLDNPGLETIQALQSRTQAIVRTGARVRLEFSAQEDPNAILETALRAGARVVSFNPIKVSLEDYFVRHVTGAGSADDAARVQEVQP